MADLSSQPTPVQTIYNWYRNGILQVNRRYQRKLVWTRLEKQKLIDSILQDYPIPLVLLAEKAGTSPSSFEILDGLQRLHTIVSFIENGFPTSNNRYFDIDEFTRAKEERESKKFTVPEGVDKISRSEVAKILEYVLSVSIIRNASESIITEVFGRINSYGHRLSDQERRQAGLLSDFSQFVRTTACEIRGDVSIDELPLYKMPEISVDLPKSKYGYRVQAEEVFWVKHGILRATDLRDSLDEQVIADITACIVMDNFIERSKDALDRIYDPQDADSSSVSSQFSAYGGERLKSEIKYCLEKVDGIVAIGSEGSLRSLVFESKTTNPFPTVFSAIFLAIHELSFKDSLVLANTSSANASLRNIHSRLNTKRDALTSNERRNNVNQIKGLIRDCFVTGDVSQIAFGVRRELDIENTLRRSQIETPSFELKQGILSLCEGRVQDQNIFNKVLQTICAIANIGPKSQGAIFIGIADKKADAERVKELDGIDPEEVGSHWLVGVDREAKILNITPEKYYQIWREKISNSSLSVALKADVLGGLDLCIFKAVHILIITIPKQKSVSLFNAKAYIREGDQTVEAGAEKILALSARFNKELA